MTVTGERTVLVAAALAVASVLGVPSPGQAQETTYTTVTGRLDPRIEVRARVDLESHRDR